MIACVRLPYFAASVERRDDDRLRQRPLVIGGQHWSVKPVYATSAESAYYGVYRGLPLREAHALCPYAEFLPGSQRRYEQAIVEVDSVLNGFTGVSEPQWTYPAAIDYLPCDDQHERRLMQYGQMIGRTVRENSGLPVSIGIGGNKFTAYMAAKLTRPEHMRVVSEHPAHFLAPIPIQSLSIPQLLQSRLHLFGIRTLGDLATLPATEVRGQFGTQGATLHQLAQGEDFRPIQNPPRELREAMRFAFDDPVADLTILERVVVQLVDGLVNKLVRNHLATNVISLQLELSDGMLLTPQRTLKQATQNGDILQRQLIHLLHGCTFQTSVIDVMVTVAHLTPVEIKQLSLFDFAEVTRHEKLEQVIAELTEQYESKLFVRGEATGTNSQLPERRYKWKKVAGSRNTAFFPIVANEIVPLSDGNDTFTSFFWQRKRHDIDAIVKMWRVDHGWWEVPAQREYFKVRTTTGLLLTIYHDQESDKWLIERIYN
jgi:DNA polymerase-4